jgi:hypothetical protein
MTVSERRRSVRYQADWPAWYQVDAHAPWRNARIIDMSRHGAAVELFDTTPREVLAGRLQLEVTSIDPDRGGLRVATWIRRRVLLRSGRVLAGLEFAPMRAEEAALLDLIVRLRVMA